MSRHEIARMVEVSSPLFAPGTEVRIVADWLMGFSPEVLGFCWQRYSRNGFSINIRRS
jgi:hypothetical protein